MVSQSYLYVLSNASMPGLLKIGRTDRSPIDRAKELSTTGVPTPFVLEYFAPVSSGVDAEATVHALLEERGYRTSKLREFFELSVAEARALIELALNITADANPDFSLKQILREELSKIDVPWNSKMGKEEAWLIGERLSDLARRGLPDAMQRAARLYEFLKWESQFRKYSQEYLLLAQAEVLTTSVIEWTGRDSRYGLGKEVARYLDTLFRNDWVSDADFAFVTKILVAGDQPTYEGYIDEAQRPDFPNEIRERALNV